MLSTIPDAGKTTLRRIHTVSHNFVPEHVERVRGKPREATSEATGEAYCEPTAVTSQRGFQQSCRCGWVSAAAAGAGAGAESQRGVACTAGAGAGAARYDTTASPGLRESYLVRGKDLPYLVVRLY